MAAKVTTIKLEEEQQARLIEIAKGLGYTSRFRLESTGNLTGLMRAIALGEVKVSRCKILVDPAEDYHV
jgi:hypothetical protein